ncbi:MAG: hypothetical protein WBI82_15105 [Sphaerochaeta sp.]
MKGINTPGKPWNLTLLSPPSLGNGPMVMLLLLSLRWGMRSIRKYVKKFSLHSITSQRPSDLLFVSSPLHVHLITPMIENHPII